MPVISSTFSAALDWPARVSHDTPPEANHGSIESVRHIFARRAVSTRCTDRLLAASSSFVCDVLRWAPTGFVQAFVASRHSVILAQLAGMTAARAKPETPEHIIEIAEILAAGLQRLLARKSSRISADRGERVLDFNRPESGPGDPDSLEVEA